MRIQQSAWRKESGWSPPRPEKLAVAPQLVLYFAGKGALEAIDCHAELKRRYPDAHILGCSTGGEIQGDEVSDDGVVATAITFERTRFKLESVDVGSPDESRDAGWTLGQKLAGEDLRCVFVLSDGLKVNGSDLVAGLTGAVGDNAPVTGGLAGDGDRFRSTLVGLDGAPAEGKVVALGLYGSALKVGHGSMGGWDVFGPERTITRATANVLYEFDGEPALELYKNYLGEHAAGLPGSALLFPLTVWPPDRPNEAVVRTIVGIDEAANSLIFAGNVPTGHVARLMHGNFDRLIDGAAAAARMASGPINGSDSIAVLVSCIGRKLLMGQRVSDEVEAARAALGPKAFCTGFYSYGEISPHPKSGMCELHNQTMTVTTLAEA